MSDAVSRLSGLSALLLAVLGVASPAGAFGGSFALTASTAVVTVGSAALIPGSSVGGFGGEPIRVVITVGSGTLLLSVTSADVTVPFGYPPLGVDAAQLAMEGPEEAVNTALAELRWKPLQQGLANLTIEAGPVAATFVPTGRAVSTLSAVVAPGVPTAFTVAPGAGSATVSWQPSSSDGGSPIIGYVVAGSPAGWCSVTASARSCVVSELVAGTDYRFQVAAINGAELGAWSEPSATLTLQQELAPAGLNLTGPITATAIAGRTTHPLPAGVAPAPPVVVPTTSPPVTAPPPATTVAPVTTEAPAVTEAPVVTDPAISTPAASGDTSAVPADTAPADAQPTTGSSAPEASSSVHVVFAVGVGVEVGAARFTVRGANLQAGSTVVVTVSSDTTVLGTATADGSGSVQWDGVLPADLADGEHALVADATAADGSALERIAPFGVTTGVLVRIGESTITTATTAVPTTPATVATIVTSPSETPAGGGSSLPKILLALLLIVGGIFGVVLWRSKAARQQLKTTWTRLREKAGQPVGRH